MTTQEKLIQFKQVIEANIITMSFFHTDDSLKIEDMFIAGGCIRSVLEGETPKDIDIFFKSNVDLEKVRNMFKLDLPHTFITDNAISLTIEGIKYQFITTCKGTPLDVINEFDFTMNMNYFDFEKNQLYIQDKMAIFDKQLKVNLNCRNKLGTLSRIAKFVNRGYKIPSQMNLLELGVQLTKENEIKDFETMQSESRLFINEDDYDSLTVVSNSRPFLEVAKVYHGSSI